MNDTKPMTIDIPRVARLAWAYRMVLARFYAIVAVLAVATVLLLPRWFTSSVSLVPAPSDAMTLNLLGAATGIGAGSIGLGGAPTPQDQLKMVVSSRAVSDSLIHDFGLVERWKLKRRDQARETLADRTTITTPREGQIIVAVEERTPELARDLAAAYARVAGLEAVRLKTSLASQRRFYLEQRLADLDVEIKQASAKIRSFEELHGAVALPEQTRETMDAAGTLQAQIALLETELAAARRYFTDQSSQVALLRDRLGELNRQIDRVARQGGTLLIKGDELPALKQEYLSLNREQLSLTAVSELLRRAYEQARVEEANPVPTFSVLDAANLPERHSRPKRGLTVLLTMALAMAGSITFLVWRADAGSKSGQDGREDGIPPMAEPVFVDETRAA